MEQVAGEGEGLQVIAVEIDGAGLAGGANELEFDSLITSVDKVEVMSIASDERIRILLNPELKGSKRKLVSPLKSGNPGRNSGDSRSNRTGSRSDGGRGRRGNRLSGRHLLFLLDCGVL